MKRKIGIALIITGVVWIAINILLTGLGGGVVQWVLIGIGILLLVTSKRAKIQP